MTTAQSAPRATARSDRRPRDMFLSLGVLLVPIAAFFLLWNFLTTGVEAREINPEPTFVEATSTGLDVLRPHGLEGQWQPISSAIDREKNPEKDPLEFLVTLRVGYQAPDGAGVQLVESHRKADAVLSSEIADGVRPEGTTALDNGEWQVYATKGGNALVYSTDKLTILVHGDTSVSELESFAATLN